jgi:hypothetical protein
LRRQRSHKYSAKYDPISDYYCHHREAFFLIYIIGMNFLIYQKQVSSV